MVLVPGASSDLRSEEVSLLEVVSLFPASSVSSSPAKGLLESLLS